MGERGRSVGFYPAGQPIGNDYDQRPIRPEEPSVEMEEVVDGLQCGLVRQGRDLNPVAKGKAEKKEDEETADVKEDKGLTEKEEPVPKKTKTDDEEADDGAPFWERRRGVEGEAGPSVGGGAQMGAKSFPEPGSGTTDGGGGGSRGGGGREATILAVFAM